MQKGYSEVDKQRTITNLKNVRHGKSPCAMLVTQFLPFYTTFEGILGSRRRCEFRNGLVRVPICRRMAVWLVVMAERFVGTQKVALAEHLIDSATGCTGTRDY